MAHSRPDLPGREGPPPSGGAPIVVKSIGEPAAASDGKRLLVSRLWPEGVTREQAALSGWRADLAPSWPLSMWFGCRADRFEEFCERYRDELQTRGKTPELRTIAAEARERRVTLVHAEPDPIYNVASALARIISEL